MVIILKTLVIIYGHKKYYDYYYVNKILDINYFNDLSNSSLIHISLLTLVRLSVYNCYDDNASDLFLYQLSATNTDEFLFKIEEVKYWSRL